MMRMSNIKMTTRVSRDQLIETVKKNFTNHAEIVQEARNGYVKKAKAALEKRLEELRKGHVTSLQFTLTPPADYSEVYKNSIAMLEWNTDDVVELQADEFRQLVRDEWDWTDDFYRSTSNFSGKAMKWLDDSIGGAMVAPEQ